MGTDWGKAYIYTNNTNIEQNNRDIDTLLEMFKRHGVRCEEDSNASITASAL